MQCRRLPPFFSRDFQVPENIQKLAVKFVKRLLQVSSEAALKWLRFFSLIRWRIPCDLKCIHKIAHIHLDMPCYIAFAAPLLASWSRFQDSPTAVLYPASPTCLQRSSSTVLDKLPEETRLGERWKSLSSEINQNPSTIVFRKLVLPYRSVPIVFFVIYLVYSRL